MRLTGQALERGDYLSDFNTFISRNRKRINEQLNIVIRICILTGPLIAIGVRLHVFADADYSTAIFISVFLSALTVVHKLLLKKHADSMFTSMIALVAIDVLLCVMNRAHLSIYLSWFLIPLLSLQFCDFKLYTIAVCVNYGFMIFSTWDVAPWFAERRIDVDRAFAYFEGRIGGLTIEMTMMIVAGFVLCRMITAYYKGMLEKTGELMENHKTLERLNVELSSMASIYYTAHDINIIDDTFFEIFANYDDVKKMIGDETGNARKLLERIMDETTDPESLPEMRKFINFDTLEERLKDCETITLEFKGRSGLWNKGRFIVSERDKAGRLKRVIWLVERIDTEKRQREALIDLSERAIAASEAKSAFLSNMSHEIRTPINAVLGMNEMILRESGEDNVLSYSSNIKIAGNTLLGLVNDILDFSKIEAGKLEILPVEYDLSSLVNDLVNMINTRADEKGLTLKLDFDREIPKVLFGDEIRIKQCVTNVLTNAVKYTEKGSITFSMTYEKPSDDPQSIDLTITVKDTGIGIKPDDLKKLFSEFERIEEKRNRKIEGTGLGMSITKSLLNMMGATLKVESEYGAGSKFWFTVRQKVVEWEPLGDYETFFKESLAIHERYKEKFTAPTAEVLVVDDNPMNLLVFKSLLKQTMVKIDTAESGEEAIDSGSRKKYDIIFMDHMMPDMDGVETLHELRNSDKNTNYGTPVVCLTANALSGAREGYIARGFDDYISKPIDPACLEDIMIKYLPQDKLNVTAAGTLQSGENLKDSGGREKHHIHKKILPEFLYDIRELDVDTGLRQNGSIDVYLGTLKLFAETADSYIDSIREFIGAGDMQNATIKIHAIKSTLRIIGAAELGEFAQRIELACRNNDTETLADETEKFLKCTKTLKEDILPVTGLAKDWDLAAANVSGDTSGDGELDKIYAKIATLALDCDNAGIEEILDKLKGMELPDSERDRVSKIAAACADFDFDAVTALIK